MRNKAELGENGRVFRRMKLRYLSFKMKDTKYFMRRVGIEKKMFMSNVTYQVKKYNTSHRLLPNFHLNN